MKDKIVLITGASLGIGRETAFQFAKEGAKLILTYYQDKKEGEGVEEKCKELGATETLLIQLNVMDNNSILKAKEEILNKFPKIDILINNAGFIVWKNLEKQSFEHIETQIRTNLEGLIKVTQTFLKNINETIINIASVAGKTGYNQLSTYCATKFGVRGFTQALAQETKLNIYNVNPGMTRTRMTSFRGVEPSQVALVILNTAKGMYKVESGQDIDVNDHI